ncbi:hypothetical protein AXX12_17345 [Anaerosporomusa subterranea]|uniref:Uncharacterized protein n=1 Tax=Anaerosporomusa subterranea TaxID=1794912 RepID=A0A154BV97_ANASB|nr:hypothetical protein [Anaerosporomusa subterranea]KYZ77827.1 hypothetical protein AXX12_17345 [Anaerosporomusa subterranea]
MVGIMQVGLGASVIEASSLHNDGPLRTVRLEQRRDNERRREHDERKRKENKRHESEMRRRSHESEREWHNRQERERDRHDGALREIAALLIEIAIGSSSN